VLVWVLLLAVAVVEHLFLLQAVMLKWLSVQFQASSIQYVLAAAAKEVVAAMKHQVAAALVELQGQVFVVYKAAE
jgi:hypothetical protein